MRAKTPFTLIPWEKDFLRSLLDLALEEQDGRLEKCLFVFPHARPARYLERLIRVSQQVAKPCLLPRALPVQALASALSKELFAPAPQAGLLDQTALLLDCVRTEKKENPGSLDLLPTDDLQAFFPWGARLAGLFEECFSSGVTPANFLYLEEELAPFAAALLSRLANLHRRYLAALDGRGWVTAALRSFRLAARLSEASASLASPFLRDARIYLAGFFKPSGAEEALLRYLWEHHGARICLHGDAALARPTSLPGREAHWSCQGLEEWRASWNASGGIAWEIYEGGPKNDQEPAARNESPTSGPRLNFYSGYDLHSQLSALQGLLPTREAAPGSLEETAVILPDTNLLLPVLHHLHPKDINISMGYPLKRSPLNMLLETVLALREKKSPSGYYWKDCVGLIRHPYIKMLAGGGEEAATAWRTFLLGLENDLRQGRRFVDLPALLEEAGADGESVASAELRDLGPLLARILLRNWEKAESLGDLALALEELCQTLLKKGERLWARFPIDAECLYRFMNVLLPELTQNLLRDEKLPQAALFSILRELMAAQRVPFDAYPLTALQIMGLLESRLLSFKRVFILEATDDLLPGALRQDPLLPDNLRREIGLPHSLRRQQSQAYYFFRLLQSAEEAHIFWEEGVESKGVFDSKKLRSRFVEELIWQEERRRKKLLKTASPNDEGASLRLLTCRPGFVKSRLRSVGAGPEARELLRKFLAGNISANRLKDFLLCPLAFYYRNLAGLAPIREVAEDGDPAAIGNILHEALLTFYKPKLGKTLGERDYAATELINHFFRCLDANEEAQNFPLDALVTLRKTGPRQLAAYLDKQPPGIRVMALEAEGRAALAGAGGAEYKLYGRLDRVDLRPWPDAGGQGAQILDYKTGKIRKPPAEFWQGEKWKALAGGPLERPEADELFSLLGEELQGEVQLPLYLYLVRHGRLAPAQEDSALHEDFKAELINTLPANAGWVALKSGGEEALLLPEDLGTGELEEILDQKIPALFRFILDYLGETTEFAAHEGERCSYCEFAELCKVSR
ncbi:PD-(D/E)XK nuclease family protein [Desulfovibrio sp. OttesenSCG-928-C14]|nr:PD-(D/E)XK nuclease family protein [Desulfovibrio sp. OttesenSCG-928-C14]